MNSMNEKEVKRLNRCLVCEGRGGLWVGDQDGGADLDVCDNCEGTGFDPGLGLYWCQMCFNYHSEADPTFADHWPRHKKVA